MRHSVVSYAKKLYVWVVYGVLVVRCLRNGSRSPYTSRRFADYHDVARLYPSPPRVSAIDLGRCTYIQWDNSMLRTSQTAEGGAFNIQRALICDLRS